MSALVLMVTLLGATGELRVCADPNNLPFSNEQQQGFENELAALLGQELHAKVTWTWFPQRRGFFKNTLKAKQCDVVMGVPLGLDFVEPSEPYYRSTYALVLGPKTPPVKSLADPALAGLRIGVPIVGDDGENPPVVLALAQRGLAGQLRGYTVYGDYSKDSPVADVVRAVRTGEVDVAVAWGPVAGYFASHGGRKLRVVPLDDAEAPPGQRFSFEVALGVRKGEAAFKAELNQALRHRRREIAALLRRYGVPTLPLAPPTTGVAWVTDEVSNEVSVIDLERGQVVSTIDVGQRPRGIRMVPGGREAVVAVSGSPRAPPGVDEATLPPPDRSKDGLVLLDVDARKVKRVLPSGDDPETFDVSRDGSQLYVSNEDAAKVSIVDVESGQVTGSLPVGGEPEGVTRHPTLPLVYVTSEATNQVFVVDVEHRHVVTRIPVGVRPRAIVFDAGGTRAWVSNEVSGSLTVIDAQRHVALQTVTFDPARDRPMGLALSPDGKWLYVTTGRGGSLVVLETALNRVVRVISEVGRRPWGVAVSADGRRVLTANGPSNDVSVIDPFLGAVLAKIPAGKSPWGVAFTQPRDSVARRR